MAAYADYTFYSTTYLGTAIASSAFSRLALRASEAIDQITFNRAAAIVVADEDDELIELIQKATCAVAEEIQSQEASSFLDGVASERVGNHQVSYAEYSRAMLSNQKKLTSAAAVYLGNSGLMFRGFEAGEYSGEYSGE